MESKDEIRKKMAREHSQELVKINEHVVGKVSGIAGLTELLADTTDDHRRRHYLGLISCTAKDMVEHLQDSVTRSQLEADVLNMRPQPCNIAVTFAEQVETWAAACERKGIVLEGFCDHAVYGTWFSDSHVIRYVLTNLLGNAVEFTKSGKVTCQLKLANVEDSGFGTLEWTIRDSGVGMTKERVEELLRVPTPDMEAYASGNVSTLNVCARLVAMMGGSLTAASTIDQGTEFVLRIGSQRICHEGDISREAGGIARERILVDKSGAFSVAGSHGRYRRLSAAQAIVSVSDTDEVLWFVSDERDMESCIQAARRAENPEGWHVFLPRRDHARMLPWCKAVGIEPYIKPVIASHAEWMIQQRVRRKLNQVRTRTLKVRVLVAEDNHVCATVLSAILRKWQCSFTVVGDGQQALDILASDPAAYDVILMNCEMPVMDGYVATTILRSMADEFPELGTLLVVGMTSASDAGSMDRAKQSGMSNCLRKPLQFHELFNAIEQVVTKE